MTRRFLSVSILGLMLAAPASFANPAAEVLATSPFQSEPFYNGDYFTIDLALDSCILTKTTTMLDADDTIEKQQTVTIDLAVIDVDRVELVGGEALLWAKEGDVVTCKDNIGEMCIIAERPGEGLRVPEPSDLLASRDFTKTVAELVTACQ